MNIVGGPSETASPSSTGVPKILRAMHNNGSPAPSFESDEERTWFLTRLPAHATFSQAAGTTRPEQFRKQHTEQDKPLQTKENVSLTEQDTEQVTKQARRLVLTLAGEMHRRQLQDLLSIAHRPHFLEAYVKPALEAGLIEMTLPDKPMSRNQRYRRTAAGEALALQIEDSRP